MADSPRTKLHLEIYELSQKRGSNIPPCLPRSFFVVVRRLPVPTFVQSLAARPDLVAGRLGVGSRRLARRRLNRGRTCYNLDIINARPLFISAFLLSEILNTVRARCFTIRCPTDQLPGRRVFLPERFFFF